MELKWPRVLLPWGIQWDMPISVNIMIARFVANMLLYRYRKYINTYINIYVD